MRRRALLAALLLAVISPSTAAVADTIRVTLPAEVTPASRSGRVIVFLVDDASRRLAGRQPVQAPFFADPQPVTSIAVEDFAPGATVELGADAVAWPRPIAELDGSWRLQAVFRCNPDEASHEAWGNPRSAVATVEFSSDEDDLVELVLSTVEPRRARENPDPRFGENLVWVELRSDLLSAFRGRDAFLRCGVAFPPAYHDVNHPRRIWPTVYVIPGFGGRDDAARNYASMLATPGALEIAPAAVHVVLDPEGPFGHHGFADGPNSGPVGRALVEELIPHLESRFRLVPEASARIVTGHSSGGWSSLWLALAHPETFGGCWSSAPDPVDFSAFQMTDLYADASVFVDAEGRETPSFRIAVAPRVDKVAMTVRQEIGVEHAMAPLGDSGQQWGAWMAMFSSKDPATGKPRWFVNPLTGAMDRQVIERDWSRYDIARIIEGDWERMKSILPRIRIACGTQDSFYLERAVIRLRDRIAARQGTEVEGDELRLGEGPGYIWLRPNATHDTIVPMTALRWGMEMREALKAAGHAE